MGKFVFSEGFQKPFAEKYGTAQIAQKDITLHSVCIWYIIILLCLLRHKQIHFTRIFNPILFYLEGYAPLLDFCLCRPETVFMTTNDLRE